MYIFLQKIIFFLYFFFKLKHKIYLKNKEQMELIIIFQINFIFIQFFKNKFYFIIF